MAPLDSAFGIGVIERKSQNRPMMTTIFQSFDKHLVPLYHSLRATFPFPAHPNFLDKDAIPMLEMFVFANMILSEVRPLYSLAEVSAANNLKVQTQSQTQMGRLSNTHATVFGGDIRLNKGEKKEIDIPVPATNRIFFSFVPEGKMKVNIELIDPSGKVLSPSNVLSYPGAQLGQGSYGEPVITVSNPKTGRWKMRCLSTEKPGILTLQVEITSSLIFSAAPDKSDYAPSSRATLQARLSGEEASTEVESVTVTLYDSSGKNVTTAVLIRQSGGVYEGSIMMPSTPGEYEMTFQVSGKLRGYPLQLQSTSWVGVSNISR